jgi:hypothetical protein
VYDAHVAFAGAEGEDVTTGTRGPAGKGWPPHRVSTLHRAERRIGWTLFAAGGAVLVGWALWHVLREWMEDDSPLLVRGAMIAVVTGMTVLLLSVAREQWLAHRRDPYSAEADR